MPKKLTIHDMRQEATSRGGKCLSKVYHNARTPLIWECAEGHQWEATSSNIRSHNSWCPQCAGVNPLDLSTAKDVASLKGGKCVSSTYINNKTPLIWECADNHQWEATLKSVKNLDTWCPYCANNVTLTLSQMQRVAIRRGGLCLSSEYQNCGTPLEWECSEGHIFSMSYDNVRQKEWCPTCPIGEFGYHSSHTSQRLSELREIAWEKGGKILSKHYVNSHTKVLVECGSEHQWEVTPANIRQGKWCPHCAGVILTLEDMHQDASSRGGKCLSEVYVNSQTSLLWECSKGHKWEAIPNSIRRGSWCPYCAGTRSTKKGITKEDLQRLYIEELKTEKEIADMYDTYQVKISRLRKKWGIPTLGKTGRLEKSLPAITSEQDQLLVGSLLGDGWMDASSSMAASFSETHSIQQEPYLRWKASLLGTHVTCIYPVLKRSEEKEYHGMGLLTHSSTHLRPYYDRFYCTGARVFPEDLVITPLTLAVWYMDDGSLQNTTPSITFGLDGLSLERALTALKRDLRLIPKVLPNADNTKTLLFSGQIDLFLDTIGPYVPPCMRYKIPKNTLAREAHKRGRRLTRGVASELYDRGMSQGEIASVFGVSRQTVSRRLKGHTKNVTEVPAESYPSFDAYDPKVYNGLPEDTQTQWVDEIFAMLKGTPFPYPEKKADPLFEYYRLRDKNVYIKDGVIVPKTLIGIGLCDGYFPNRFHAKYKDQMSVVEGWSDDTYLRKAIEMQLKTGDPLIPRRICKGIQYMVRTPTIFRPGVAKCLYQTYAEYGATVWDPCAGYGGRLLGAIAAGMTYLGCDVEPLTVKGNLDLAKDIKEASRANVFCIPAENFNPLDHVEKVDMVFTSPPYFDREKYSDKDAQSWRGYSSLEAWVSGFLTPIIKTSYNVLSQGGILALNICDIQDRGKMTPLEKITCDVAIDVGFSLKEVLKMPLSNLSPRDHEPVFVFEK